jgi:hypothetical protein
MLISGWAFPHLGFLLRAQPWTINDTRAQRSEKMAQMWHRCASVMRLGIGVKEGQTGIANPQRAGLAVRGRGGLMQPEEGGRRAAPKTPHCK